MQILGISLHLSRIKNQRFMRIEDLVGKTITSAKRKKPVGFDDEGFLLLEFSDGTDALIVAGFEDNYTGNSLGEYPTYLALLPSSECCRELTDL